MRIEGGMSRAAWGGRALATVRGWLLAAWRFLAAAASRDIGVPVVGPVLSALGLSGVGYLIFRWVRGDHGTEWAVVAVVAYALLLAFAEGVRLQREKDVRGEIALRFTDYEFCDVIGTEGPRGVVILQGSFVVHNDGPDSDFEAWVPHDAIDWAGPSRLYGGFHLCWNLSTSLDERRRFIPRGSQERVDVVAINSATRDLTFLGPGRRAYMTLQHPQFEVTGTIEIRDVNRDGARVPVSFKLTYRQEDEVATFRVPANHPESYT